MPATLTRIVLNRSHPAARNDLRDRVNLHKTLMRLLDSPTGPNPRKSGGLLFRLEHAPDPFLLVQTAQSPKLGGLPAGYGTLATRDLTPLLTALTAGLNVRYRITAAATASVPSAPKAGNQRRARGTDVLLEGHDAIGWWQRRAAAAGLGLTGPVTAAPEPFASPKRPAPFFKLTQFDGTATITDSDALHAALRDGIGKGKTYGAGLLTLMPA
ncbi:type I-E CRISPR-associated protein Cas6/Cse3/CasE [Streptomyces sp. NPDC051976]|uniref:type I-E CRISPR-associated protein Cas6/Cse3/CasE n=1 Tax=Streptomyces sp. NPDC051976 TaxID=3154947 RepID=UPI00344AB4EE